MMVGLIVVHRLIITNKRVLNPSEAGGELVEVLLVTITEVTLPPDFFSMTGLQDISRSFTPVAR